MKSKVSSSRLVFLSGKIGNRIVDIPTVCVRRNFIRLNKEMKAESIRYLKSSEVMGMVSHPGLARGRTAPYIMAWCHPFTDESFINSDKPKILLSESDFVDPIYVQILPKKKIKWDFFCFTIGGRKNRDRKGTGLLVKCLEILSSMRMKGIVINYGSKDLFLIGDEKKSFKKSIKSSIKYVRKKLNGHQVAKIMSESRFGLFPNWKDCSPLMISESLIRDTPVFVNENIYGGWKYVNSHTGGLFNSTNIKDKAEDLICSWSSFQTKEYFLDNYGFQKTSIKLANWGRTYFRGFNGTEKVCFSGLSKFL